MLANSPSGTPGVLAPGELDDRHVGRRIRVGGRLLDVGSPWLVGDAFSVVAVSPRAPAPPALTAGGLVVVDGRLCATRTMEQPARWALSEADLVWHGAGTARLDGEHAHVHGPRASALRQRARLTRAIRDLFDAAGFVEVETPCIVPSPGLDLHIDAFEVATAPPRFLSTSPEYQMKRLLTGGLPRIYQLARAYRREERGTWHNPEFTLLEWYRAFAGVGEVMEDTEDVVCAVAAAAGTREALDVPGVGRVSLVRPFERVSVTEAFARHANVDREELCHIAKHDEDRYFRLLIDRVEPALARRAGPVFLCDYPASQASLAQTKPDDPAFCERFELYVGGIELCNGFGELTDAQEQRARFGSDRAERAQQGKAVYPVDRRFVEALDEGMPPAAGNALGLDRLFALALGKERLSDVMAFDDEWL